MLQQAIVRKRATRRQAGKGKVQDEFVALDEAEGRRRRLCHEGINSRLFSVLVG